MRTTHLRIVALLLTLGLFVITSCMKDDNRTVMLDMDETVKSIPSDSKATPNPSISNPNTSIPNINYSVEEENGKDVVRIDMTGVQDPNGDDWLRLIGTNGGGNNRQNVWVSVDDQPKGISVHNTIDDNDSDVVIKNDFVFLVDNSGSMSEEADAIARDIINWARNLNAVLDVRFGCVGYDGEITGAINLTTYEEVAEYLNNGSGTSRTCHFGGSDYSYLRSNASSYYVSGSQDECGMAALHYANDLFNFRRNANRIYVNFTDEYNYTGSNPKYSVSYLSSQYNWSTTSGTIHTVYSSSDIYSSESVSYEMPWRMSEYTGGSILYTSSSFSGVSLDDLPVTSAMQNSYIIKFTNIEPYMDGNNHEVKITIKSRDGSVRAEKTFYINFGY